MAGATQRRPFFWGARFASEPGGATQGAASDFPVTFAYLRGV